MVKEPTILRILALVGEWETVEIAWVKTYQATIPSQDGQGSFTTHLLSVVF